MRGASTSGVGRGEAVRAAFAMFAGVGAPAMFASIYAPAAVADFAYQPALVGKDYGKSKMTYPDFQQTASGLLYKVSALSPCAPPSRPDCTTMKPSPRCQDATVGRGKSPASGDRVVVDWSGYTIGCVRRARSEPPRANV